ncbi:MAG TPA: L-2-hydroxyglutarate oxidase [Sedimentisphaerales bacterium]|nr:L-2-hydroxyglutarate oxidase [Sedimentisphaerales bacterium]HNU28774.1 L-2-hydroxyglutarate oxidase [Sedimentisphaerales bacterium]
MTKTDFDIVVVGGGIVGLACAYKIVLAHPRVRIAVLEKEGRLASHQTGRNSGVIHSGLYYKPGSAKAATCTAGRKELIEFAGSHGIRHDLCGKIIVATDPAELPALERIEQNGAQNGVEGLQRIGPDRIKEIEPFAAGIAALHVPSAGIIDFVAVAHRLADLVQDAGGRNKVLLYHRVLGFDKHDFYTNVLTTKGRLSTRYLINCAGLHSDRVARMDGVDPSVRIIPFRGDYSVLSGAAAGKVRNLIYPVPDPQFPFLGVHFTRMVNGTVECGPNAVFAFKREGYCRTDLSLRDTWESLSYPGTWRLFARHWRYGLGEYARALRKKLLVEQLQRLVPSLTAEDIQPGNAGVRAQALGPQGDLVDDFKIEVRGNAIHVLNAPSPAATASLAIGSHINQVATERFDL